MNIFERSLQRSLRFRLRFQFLSAVIVVIAFGYLSGDFLAAAFGGMIPLCGTLLLIIHSRRAQRMGATDSGTNIRVLYRCAIERIVVVVLLFSLGLGLLGLEPLPLVTAFVIGQVVFLMGGLKAQR